MRDEMQKLQISHKGLPLPSMGSSLESVASENRRHGFFIGTTGLLLPKGIVCEVRNELHVTRLPNAPRWVIGMVNLRGNIVPLLDMAFLLGIDVPHYVKQKQLFFLIDDEWVGIYSDGLPKLLSISAEDRLEDMPAVPEQLQPFVSGCYQQDTLWFDCDIRSIFQWIAEQKNAVV